MLSDINYRLLTNALSFQIAWFICVQGNNLYAVLTTVCLLSLHAILFRINTYLQIKSSLLLLAFCLIGFIGDNLIAFTVDLTYSNYQNNQILSLTTLGPVWLLCLWLSFSITMNHSMKWLFQSPVIAFCIGLLFVPLSYIAGITLSESTLLAPYWQFFILEGLWWALLLTGYQILNSDIRKKSIYQGAKS